MLTNAFNSGRTVLETSNFIHLLWITVNSLVGFTCIPLQTLEHTWYQLLKPSFCTFTETIKRGILEIDGEMKVTAFLEKPRPEETKSRRAVSRHWVNLGMWCVQYSLWLKYVFMVHLFFLPSFCLCSYYIDTMYSYSHLMPFGTLYI